jgi:branched-chain amino acid transport system ATP-binding protein
MNETNQVNGILEISALNKNFGGVRAIDDFHVSIAQGGVHGLIGPNGAGKTTVFNVITGIYRPDGGKIRFNGRDITGLKTHKIAQMGIARTFQNIRLFSNLSVLQNVVIASGLDLSYNMLHAFLRLPLYRREEARLREKAMDLLQTVGLQDLAHARANSLPYGHQRRLEIARAIALNPVLLLLDEPAAGMNAEESADLIGFIQKIKERFRLTILMIEHHMDVVAGLCDRVTVLNFGKTLAEATVAEIKNNKQVVEAYLGEEH